MGLTKQLAVDGANLQGKALKKRAWTIMARSLPRKMAIDVSAVPLGSSEKLKLDQIANEYGRWKGDTKAMQLSALAAAHPFALLK